MRFVRYQTRGGEPRLGWILDDRVGPVIGALFAEYIREEADIPLSSVRLLAPLQPGKILCVGRNYAAHAKEHNVEVPEVPLLFLKPPSSVTGPDMPVVYPPQTRQLEHEAELAVVIGRQGRWITADAALDYVLGYTVANDITARDLQRLDGQWTRGKGFDTFCPIGPWIETELDTADLLVTCRVNGETRQMGSTRDMVFSIRQLVAFASSVMTLEPGDLILTGTPSGVGPMLPGDTVEVEIEKLGVLRNTIVAEGAR